MEKEGIWQANEDCALALIMLATRGLLLNLGDHFTKTAVNKYYKSKIPKPVKVQTSYHMKT
jgi:hypothetical protein